MTMQKIPATIITGFLGAGKTSTIRSLLATAGGKRLALIINEFGDLGVDGEIVKGCGIEGCADEDILELANGCICCTVADDFLPTIQKLLDRPNPPDHIIIETSGLALPKPLIKAFAWPEVRTRTTVDGVVAVIDAAALAEGRFAEDEDALEQQRAGDEALDHDSPLAELFEEQLAAADLVILNKCDLIDAETRQRLIADLHKAVRAGVKVISASDGDITSAILLGLDAAAEDDLDARPSHHDGVDGDHDHDDFDSFVAELPSYVSAESLVARLQQVVLDHGVLRIKGFAAIQDRDMRLVVQGVGPRFQHYFDRDWRQDEGQVTRLVVIGEKGLDSAAITAALEN